MTAYSILGGGVILGAAAASGGITTLAPLSVAGILGRKCSSSDPHFEDCF